jgi:hypothetical protein
MFPVYIAIVNDKNSVLKLAAGRGESHPETHFMSADRFYEGVSGIYVGGLNEYVTNNPEVSGTIYMLGDRFPLAETHLAIAVLHAKQLPVDKVVILTSNADYGLRLATLVSVFPKVTLLSLDKFTTTELTEYIYSMCCLRAVNPWDLDKNCYRLAFIE